MLRDLTRNDWLNILGTPRERIPRVLLVRGTRDLRRYYQAYRSACTDVLDLGDENSVLADLFAGYYSGIPIAYASVYGPSMASEVTHVFGMLGTPLVVQLGNCGALAEELATGDLFIATEAYCGEGAAQYYIGPRKTVTTRIDPAVQRVLATPQSVPCHRGRIFTTAALFAEGDRDLEECSNQGFHAVDMETATTFAVAEHFGMDRLSILIRLG